MVTTLHDSSPHGSWRRVVTRTVCTLSASHDIAGLQSLRDPRSEVGSSRDVWKVGFRRRPHGMACPSASFQVSCRPEWAARALTDLLTPSLSLPAILGRGRHGHAQACPSGVRMPHPLAIIAVHIGADHVSWPRSRLLPATLKRGSDIYAGTIDRMDITASFIGMDSKPDSSEGCQSLFRGCAIYDPRPATWTMPWATQRPNVEKPSLWKTKISQDLARILQEVAGTAGDLPTRA